MRTLVSVVALVLVQFLTMAGQGAAQPLIDSDEVLTVDPGTTPLGAHDSTTGSARFMDLPELSLSPESLHFSDFEAWESFTVTNDGAGRSRPISATVPEGGYDMQNHCGTLESGESCVIELKPNDPFMRNATLRVTEALSGAIEAQLTQNQRVAIRHPQRCDDCPFGWFVYGGHHGCSGGCMPEGSYYLYCTDCNSITERYALGRKYPIDSQPPGDITGSLYCGSIRRSAYPAYRDGAAATEVAWTTPLPGNGYSGAPHQYPRICEIQD